MIIIHIPNDVHHQQNLNSGSYCCCFKLCTSCLITYIVCVQHIVVCKYKKKPHKRFHIHKTNIIYESFVLAFSFERLYTHHTHIDQYITHSHKHVFYKSIKYHHTSFHSNRLSDTSTDGWMQCVCVCALCVTRHKRWHLLFKWVGDWISFQIRSRIYMYTYTHM